MVKGLRGVKGAEKLRGWRRVRKVVSDGRAMWRIQMMNEVACDLMRLEIEGRKLEIGT